MLIIMAQEKNLYRITLNPKNKIPLGNWDVAIGGIDLYVQAESMAAACALSETKMLELYNLDFKATSVITLDPEADYYNGDFELPEEIEEIEEGGDDDGGA